MMYNIYSIEILKGHPLGATGLAQCAELTWQLRGTLILNSIKI